MKKYLSYGLSFILIAAIGVVSYLYINATAYNSHDKFNLWIYEKKITHKAENGDNQAQYELALHIIAQRPSEDEQALEWLTKAADANHVKAILSLPVYANKDQDKEFQTYLNGYYAIEEYSEGESQYHLSLKYADDKEKKSESIELLKLAAKNGFPEAQYRLAIYLSKQTENNKEWLNLLSLAADKDHIKAHLLYLSNAEKLAPQALQQLIESIEAQSDFESRYQLVLLLKDQPDRATEEIISLLNEAARGGHVAAQYELGLALNEENTEESGYWLKQSAKAGNVKAQLALGHHFHRLNSLSNYRDRGLLNLTTLWFENAAQAGDAKAQYELSQLYRYHHDDKGLADVWPLVEKSAKQGYPDAEYELGERYSDLLRGEKNESKAFYWYKKAADQGHIKAKVVIGHNYFFDSSTNKKNPELGLKLLKQAADQGDTEAMTLIGREYYYEHALPRDVDKAIYWLEKAIANENMHSSSGPSDAQQVLKVIKDKTK